MKITTVLIDKIYISGVRPKYVLDVTIILLQKNQAKKCNKHRTISLIPHSRKIVAHVFSKILESRIEQVIREDQLGFWIGKGIRYTIVLMRIISKRVLDVKEIYLYFIDSGLI